MLDRDTASRKAVVKPASLGLRATDANGVLRIEWDGSSRALRGSARASLDIKDGKSSVPIALDAEQVRQGYFNYSRKLGDLELQMTAFPANGAPIREFTKFVGAPIAPRLSNEQASGLGQERDKLKVEVQQLRESLRKESVRNRQLEETVRILEQRVQVEKLFDRTTR